LEAATADTGDKGAKTVGFADLILALVRHRGLVVGLTGAGFLLSLAVALLLPPKYRATAKVLPPQRGQEPFSSLLGEAGGAVPDIARGLLGAGSASDLYVGILQSGPIREAVVDRFHLKDKFHVSSWIEANAELDKKVMVAPGKKDGIITLTVEDRDPKLAADIANAFVEELGKFVERLDGGEASRTRAFYEKRLVEAKADLALAEDRLKAFQAGRKVIEVPEQAQAALKELVELKARLAAQEVQLTTLRRTHTDSTQDVKNLKASIEKLTSQIKTMEEGTKVGGALPSLGSVPSLGQAYARLVRDIKTQEALASILTKQYETADLLERKGAARLNVIESARVPDRRSGPKRKLIVLFSTVVAFFSSLPLAFLAEYARSAPEEERQKWSEVRRLLRGSPR
jgi:uncharacterized protein involved in exopolysaccharide biosynthesis